MPHSQYFHASFIFTDKSTSFVCYGKLKLFKLSKVSWSVTSPFCKITITGILAYHQQKKNFFFHSFKFSTFIIKTLLKFPAFSY